MNCPFCGNETENVNDKGENDGNFTLDDIDWDRKTTKADYERITFDKEMKAYVCGKCGKAWRMVKGKPKEVRE
jgi:hypothetical protein